MRWEYEISGFRYISADVVVVVAVAAAVIATSSLWLRPTGEAVLVTPLSTPPRVESTSIRLISFEMSRPLLALDLDALDLPSTPTSTSAEEAAPHLEVVSPRCRGRTIEKVWAGIDSIPLATTIVDRDRLWAALGGGQFSLLSGRSFVRTEDEDEKDSSFSNAVNASVFSMPTRGWRRVVLLQWARCCCCCSCSCCGCDCGGNCEGSFTSTRTGMVARGEGRGCRRCKERGVSRCCRGREGRERKEGREARKRGRAGLSARVCTC